MNESSPTITPVLEKKTPELSEAGKKEFASEITIANKNIQEIEGQVSNMSEEEFKAKMVEGSPLKKKLGTALKCISAIAFAGLTVGVFGGAIAGGSGVSESAQKVVEEVASYMSVNGGAQVNLLKVFGVLAVYMAASYAAFSGIYKGEQIEKANA